MPATSTPSLSVVVPNHNGLAVLPWCLEALLEELPPEDGEVIVVDDHSTDGDVAWLRRTHPGVRVVELQEARGFAAACNAGAAAARAPLIVFLNSDAEVRPGWAAALRSAAARHPRAAVIGTLAVFRDSPETVNSAGVVVTTAASAADVGLGRPLSEVFLQERELAAVSGVSMLVRASWFAATGGFDERLFMYFEDVELSIRAWLEGYTVALAPQAVVRHAGSTTAGGRHLPLRSYYGSRNRLLMAAALMSWGGLLRAIPVQAAQDLAAAVVLVLGGQPRLALRAYRGRLRGTWAALRLLGQVRRNPWSSLPRSRTFAELVSLGVVEPWSRHLGEFVRIRSRELRRGAPRTSN